MYSTQELVDEIWRAGIAPDQDISVSTWADDHRMLPPTAAEPGRWRTARTPYLAEIMDALSPASGIEQVVVMAGAQVGKTEVGLNLLGAIVHLWPGLALHVSPTTEAARRLVRTRVDPMIEAAPELAGRIVRPGPRKAGNSATLKAYPGGSLAFVGANSGVGLRSTPARFVILDEVDGFPADAGGDGDPVQLAIARTVTFRGRRKILLLSTPTIVGISRIDGAFRLTDQRRFFWPCRHCGDFFVATWAHIEWPEGEPERATLICPTCGGVHEERDKRALLAAGEWRPTADGSPRIAGFHISGLMSPFLTWGEIAVDFLNSKRDASQLQVWSNTKLGEPFEDRETAPLSPDALAARAIEVEQSWLELLPDGVAVLTAGVDVQDDRIEIEIVGWGRSEESWSVAYEIIHGDTSRPPVWDALDRLLTRRFRLPRAAPDLPIAAAAIDSGHRTDVVMHFTAARQNRRVWAVKGRGGAGVAVWPKRPPKVRRGGVAPVFVVGVDALKTTLMARLKIEEPAGPGACHFPADRDFWWFAGLVAERPIRKWHRGVPRIEWVPDRGVRNEPLDCRNYATAALHGLYAVGFSLADAATRIAAAPLRAGGDQDQPATPPATRIIRSKFLDR